MKFLKAIKSIGLRFRATGATFWLGIAMLFACVWVHLPAPAMTAVAIVSILWSALCIISCIPARYLIVGDPGKERLKERVKQETEYADEMLSKLQDKQKSIEDLQGKRGAIEQEVSNLKKQLFNSIALGLLIFCGLSDLIRQVGNLYPLSLMN